jgi:hypothetical protein
MYMALVVERNKSGDCYLRDAVHKAFFTTLSIIQFYSTCVNVILFK